MGRAVIFLLLCPALAWADTLYLKDGRIVRGEVLSETDEVVSVKEPIGTSGYAQARYLKSQVERIERGPTQHGETLAQIAAPPTTAASDAPAGQTAEQVMTEAVNAEKRRAIHEEWRQSEEQMQQLNEEEISRLSSILTAPEISVIIKIEALRRALVKEEMSTSPSSTVPEMLVRNQNIETLRRQLANEQISRLSSAVENYKAVSGVFPVTLKLGAVMFKAMPSTTLAEKKKELKVVRQQIELVKALTSDPWVHEYRYVYPGRHGAFDLFSVGQDGQEGTADDVTNW